MPDGVLTREGVVRDGKALQMGTSHELGQNFARAFRIRFSDRDGHLRHVWQTSWGASTRLLGALIMVHGDDRGLRIPPRLAPTQVVVLAAHAGEGVVDAASATADDLRRHGIRVDLDDRLEISLGRRIVDHELRGVPLRVEIGPRELAAGHAVAARRTTGSKEILPLHGLAGLVRQMLEDDQRELLAQANALRNAKTESVQIVQAAQEVASRGFARIPWRALGLDGEGRLAEGGISVRCLIREDGEPVNEPDEDRVEALVARAY